ncbi:mandelate racemase/muconate lactonizing enzyme family protein [Rhodobacter sp. SY28-1]|uniref:mandelate racemase/muconate lactonizing enzyme family protein n=1 Tax=Rhodobacter sp. SY28-1 TaxID=2562317 RepID=UPI0010C10AEF|nr:mandelate racemase/muconate lactonizing enzyme family protein [Rhodobacter sp. SY28-1]
MRIVDFRITRIQFPRDRVIGDSQVRTDLVSIAALELIDQNGQSGLGFMQSLFTPMPAQAEMERLFLQDVWPGLDGQHPAGLVHRINRPRGGNIRPLSLPAHEAVQVALWDLAGKQLGLPLWQLLGGIAPKPVPAYASGLDFHLSDDDFCDLFGKANAQGYSAFKIKVGHPVFERDLHRLALLQKTVRKGARIMVDANEAWGAKEAAVKVTAIRDAGFDLTWVEDPILRNDFEGLRLLRKTLPFTMINSGEYLDASGKLALMKAGATDVLNVHGQISDVMRVAWVAAEWGVPISLGNTFLEVGIHLALALPEVGWLEYSFQNFDHLVDQTLSIRDGVVGIPEAPGHGLTLSEAGRKSARDL